MVTRATVGHLRSYPYVLDPFLIRGNRFEATIPRQPDHRHKDLLRRPILDDHISKATGEAYPKSGVWICVLFSCYILLYMYHGDLRIVFN